MGSVRAVCRWTWLMSAVWHRLVRAGMMRTTLVLRLVQPGKSDAPVLQAGVCETPCVVRSGAGIYGKRVRGVSLDLADERGVAQAGARGHDAHDASASPGAASKSDAPVLQCARKGSVADAGIAVIVTIIVTVLRTGLEWSKGTELIPSVASKVDLWVLSLELAQFLAE
ncbi:hypothetical protein RIF29_15036 [Crotalaria pallida]|uniref:Uncharacterized protein n=1 Tax=Crotalaria pallida TaxID=3830 RepID=A0AAN9IAV7_CROPI